MPAVAALEARPKVHDMERAGAQKGKAHLWQSGAYFLAALCLSVTVIA